MRPARRPRGRPPRARRPRRVPGRAHGARAQRAAAGARLRLRRGRTPATSRDLALELFDSARAAGLHRYGDEQRELFGNAALLHDIGTFLSYSDHHLHSYYLIRHADLLGFDENEIATMAATALFHRKAKPGARHPAFAELDRDDAQGGAPAQRAPAPGGVLDRGHTGSVAHAALRRDGRRDLVLEVRPAGDWHLERWRLENRKEAIEQALGRGLTVTSARAVGAAVRPRHATARGPDPRRDPARGPFTSSRVSAQAKYDLGSGSKPSCRKSSWNWHRVRSSTPVSVTTMFSSRRAVCSRSGLPANVSMAKVMFCLISAG